MNHKTDNVHEVYGLEIFHLTYLVFHIFSVTIVNLSSIEHSMMGCVLQKDILKETHGDICIDIHWTYRIVDSFLFFFQYVPTIKSTHTSIQLNTSAGADKCILAVLSNPLRYQIDLD